jgi:hypothetical protein
MHQFVVMTLSTIFFDYKKSIFVILGLIIYYIYYRKFSFYVYEQKDNLMSKFKRIGKTLPPHPNGWFVILRSDEISKTEIKHIQTHGEDLVVHRELNGTIIVQSIEGKKLSQEHSGLIYVWFTKDVSQLNEPEYFPFDVTNFTDRLEARGRIINKVNCHISDIAENGADLAHFLYVHNEFVPKLVIPSWKSVWVKGDDYKLREKMYLNDEIHDKFRNSLLDKYIDEKNKKYIGVFSIEIRLNILKVIKGLHFFTITGFQLGSGIVYIFFKSAYQEILIIQYIQTKGDYEQFLFHDMFADCFIPYWFTALHLRTEASQILNDGVIWDNKKFSLSPYYNNKDPYDNLIISFREWYAQFFKGQKN